MGNKTYRNKSQITKINVFTFTLCIWENLYIFQKPSICITAFAV